MSPKEQKRSSSGGVYVLLCGQYGSESETSFLPYINLFLSSI
jgi:hypothetical protein